MDIITSIFAKTLSVFMSLVSIVPFSMPGAKAEADHSRDKTNYPFIFVHGFWGWGEYDKGYDTLPYWGALTGNMVKSFNESGYTAAAASVDPVGSAWDRACELYAQLTGSIVDYGAAHSKKYGHDRYGEDYTGKALIEEWDASNKINIINHSFGGPTCALFASILEYGCEEEIEATTDGSLSPFFEGGKGDYVYSITGIAGAYNGTTLTLCAGSLPDTLYAASEKAVTEGAKTKLGYFRDGNVGAPDTALYDMNPDNAVVMNEGIKTVDSIYYFTIPCCTTKISERTGNSIPDLEVSDFSSISLALTMGKLNTVTKGGIEIGREWQPNDGEVNTISARGPAEAAKSYIGLVPCPETAVNGFEKGVYNVMKTYAGSHNCLMGNVTRPNKDALPYLVSLMEMINSL